MGVSPEELATWRWLPRLASFLALDTGDRMQVLPPRLGIPRTVEPRTVHGDTIFDAPLLDDDPSMRSLSAWSVGLYSAAARERTSALGASPDASSASPARVASRKKASLSTA
jgi:hypothetical protein